VGATGSDRAQTGDGERDANDLTNTRALAECDDGERDSEDRLKRRDHGRQSRRQTDVHRHEENPELPDTDE
jgi:hypothetical protein